MVVLILKNYKATQHTIFETHLVSKIMGRALCTHHALRHGKRIFFFLLILIIIIFKCFAKLIFMAFHRSQSMPLCINSNDDVLPRPASIIYLGLHLPLLLLTFPVITMFSNASLSLCDQRIRFLLVACNVVLVIAFFMPSFASYLAVLDICDIRLEYHNLLVIWLF